MKIYFQANAEFKNYSYPWLENIAEQIKETVFLIADECEMNIYEWGGENGKCPYFPAFAQEDIHTRFIRVGASHYNFGETGPYYCLFFVWEPADFFHQGVYADEEEEADEKTLAEQEYSEICKHLGLPQDYEVEVPDGFVYIGSYVNKQKTPLSLPGLEFESEDDGVIFLTPRMYGE